MDKTIVVGDAHIAPNQNLRRALWLGRLIKDVKPNRLVYIGDLGSFDSLSDWDKDKRKLMEGRRFSKDVESLKEFQRLVQSTKPPSHETILTEGNHEHRIERYIEHHPVIDGRLDYLNMMGVRDDWKIIPYKSFYKHKGVAFTHVPIMESGKPVSGERGINRALQVCNHSIVYGHTHKLEYKAVHRHGASHLQEALNVGCFFEHVDAYALGSVTSYWRGLIVMTHYDYGRFSFESIPLGLLRREYQHDTT